MCCDINHTNPIKNEIEENQAIRTMREISKRARENGMADMSLDEINAEIQDSRNEN